VHASLALIVIVVGTALLFDYTNGFHDTANAMATTIATRALKPRLAVSLAALLNFAGAFISVSVAATIASGIVEQNLVTVPIVFAGLVGAIVWNLVTWYFRVPSSSSHALIGGVILSAFAERIGGARAHPPVTVGDDFQQVLDAAGIAHRIQDLDRGAARAPPASPRSITSMSSCSAIPWN